MLKVQYENLIIRKSKVIPGLYLSSNQENVYRVILDGQEKMNGLDYAIASNFFETLEKGE